MANMSTIAIIGGGIIGTGIAYYLRELDANILLFEKDMLGAGSTSDSVSNWHWLQYKPEYFEHKIREAAWEKY
jgi:sarcosine oxidase subunit beta